MTEEPEQGLIAYVRAQLDELEASADDVHRMDEGNVELCDLYWFVEGEHMGNGSCTCGEPAAVRASVAADRAVLDLHVRHPERQCCRTCGDPWLSDADDDINIYPCATVRALAQKFAGRPGWQDEWTLTA